MRYRPPARPRRNELYKGFYIVPDDSGEKYSIVDAFGTLHHYPSASIADAQAVIDARYRERLDHGKDKTRY
jgi:hypothetical protein